MKTKKNEVSKLRLCPLGRRGGQSTVEYIILSTAVIATAILFLNGDGSHFRKKLTGSLTTVSDKMEDMSNRLASSTPAASAGSMSKPPAKTIDPLAGRCEGETRLSAKTGKCE